MKSQVRHNTTSPEWNEDFRFLVHVPGQQYLNGELKDWDRLSASDEIGRYECDIFKVWALKVPSVAASLYKPLVRDWELGSDLSVGTLQLDFCMSECQYNSRRCCAAPYARC